MDSVISTCTIKDLEVWKQSSKRIIQFIPAKNYIVIVPDNEVKLFNKSTDKKFQVKPESLFAGKLREILKERVPNTNQDRIGWYLQQLLKFYAGFVIPDILQRYLIIDCDTHFLKPTKF